MEKILIAYSGSGDKPVADDIQKQLRKAGFPSTLGAVTLMGESNPPSLVVPVVSDASISDAAMIDILAQAGELNINVVPYISARLEPSLTSRFFLDEHVWIDAQTQNQQQAIGDLVDCVKNNFKVISQKAQRKSDQTMQAMASGSKGKAQAAASAPKGNKATNAQQANPGIYKNLFYIALAVIGVMLFILVSGGARQTNREAQNQQANLSNSRGNSNVAIQLSSDLRKSESALVGRWQMSDYTDNQFRATRQDSLELQGMVDMLLNRAQLVFMSDKTFQRYGFSENPENGVWEYDPQSRYLKLQPTGVNQYDVVQLQEVSDDKMVIVVQEKVGSSNIITKMTFTKIAKQ